MLKPRHAVSVFLSLLPFIQPAFAQSGSVEDCRTIPDRLARYTCYDRYESGAPVASSRSTSNSSTTSASTSPNASSARVQEREEDDGLPIIGRFFDRDRDEEEAPTVATNAPVTAESEVDNFGRVNPEDDSRLIEGTDGKELIADVAALDERGRNQWVITLANGQTWVQMESKVYRLQVGDSVRIYPTRWGNSYRLTSERLSGYIQVRRRVDSDAAVSSAAPEAATPSAPAVSSAPSSASVQEPEARSGLPIIGRFFNRDRDEDERDEEAPAVADAANVEDFGRENPEDARIIDGADGKELIANIAALEERGRNLWLITLENGQTWAQIESKTYRLQVGDSVRIYPTRWGDSYRLTADRVSGYIQVRRAD
jgi:hypothetical protein